MLYMYIYKLKQFELIIVRAFNNSILINKRHTKLTRSQIFRYILNQFSFIYLKTNEIFY